MLHVESTQSKVLPLLLRVCIPYDVLVNHVEKGSIRVFNTIDIVDALSDLHINVRSQHFVLWLVDDFKLHLLTLFLLFYTNVLSLNLGALDLIFGFLRYLVIVHI